MWAFDGGREEGKLGVRMSALAPQLEIHMLKASALAAIVSCVSREWRSPGVWIPFGFPSFNLGEEPIADERAWIVRKEFAESGVEFKGLLERHFFGKTHEYEAALRWIPKDVEHFVGIFTRASGAEEMREVSSRMKHRQSVSCRGQIHDDTIKLAEVVVDFSEQHELVHARSGFCEPLNQAVAHEEGGKRGNFCFQPDVFFKRVSGKEIEVREEW